MGHGRVVPLRICYHLPQQFRQHGKGRQAMIIDGMMHLEANGQYWDGLIEEVIEHYDAAGIDKGVVLATWMPSRESNDRTRAACRQYPDRFLPFGHVRPVDEWED